MGKPVDLGGGTRIDPANFARADAATLLAKVKTLSRHVEHQRIIMALMCRRLGGYVAFHEAALARATAQYDVEIGDQSPLQLPTEEEDVQLLPHKISFRLVAKDGGEKLEAGLKILPQRVIDLVDAVQSHLDVESGKYTQADPAKSLADVADRMAKLRDLMDPWEKEAEDAAQAGQAGQQQEGATP